MNDTKQTTLEDRVQDLEKEVNKMRDTLIWKNSKTIRL